MLAAIYTYRDALRNQCVILFVDNCPVVDNLVKYQSASDDAHLLIILIHCLLQKHNVTWWFEWVPSKSNLADSPSRDVLDHPADSALLRAPADSPRLTDSEASLAILQAVCT